MRLLIADDGLTALRFACETRTDLAVLDIEMPGMGGPDVASALLRRVPVQEAGPAPDAARQESWTVLGHLEYEIGPVSKRLAQSQGVWLTSALGSCQAAIWPARAWSPTVGSIRHATMTVYQALDLEQDS